MNLITDKKLDHIAIAVNDIKAATDLYCSLLNLEETHRELVENEHLEVTFLCPKVKNLNVYSIELIRPTSNQSPVYKFIEKKGEGIHHIAYLVNNLEKGINEMIENGAQLLDGYPRNGSRNKKIAFFHPKTTFGCLIELCAIS